MAQAFAKSPDYNARRINKYVPGLQYAANVQPSGVYRTSLGTPAVASATNILSAQSIASASSTTTLLDDTADARFGMNLQFVASGASTSTVTVTGRDYLGQPMKETVTLNGTTAVHGVKAFYWLDSIAWTATSATTMNVGWGASLGLPYATYRVLDETWVTSASGVLTPETIVATPIAVASAGSALTAGTLMLPNNATATATTSDPRGLYAPKCGGTAGASFDSTKEIIITAIANNAMLARTGVALGQQSVDNVVGGGLYGVRHYFA